MSALEYIKKNISVIVNPMTEYVTSSKRTWVVGAFFVVSAYLGVCAGSAWYLKRSAQKILQKLGLLKSQVRVQYFPFPALTIDFKELSYKKISIQGTKHFTPYLPGILSGRYMKMITNATFKGEDLNGSYQQKSYFSLYGLNQHVASFKADTRPKNALTRIQAWTNLLRGLQNIEGSNKGSATFKTYQSTFSSNVTSSGPHHVQFEIHNGTQKIVGFTMKGTQKIIDQDTHLETKTSLLLHPEALSMTNTLSRCITGKEMLTAWVLENQTRVQELFLPFTLSFDVKGHCPTEKLKAFNEQAVVLDTHSQPEPTQPPIQQLKKIAALPVNGTATITLSAAKTARVQGRIALKHTLEAQNKNKLKCDIDLEWSSFLAHFAKRSPESYQNAERLFAFILKLINKNKTPEHIAMHLHTTYDANTLAIEEFTINDMPFGQLLQAFFSNPDMHKHLR